MRSVQITTINELVQISREHYASHGGNPTGISPILYRGQADAEWSLQTTLERFSVRRFTLAEYTDQINLVATRLASHTDERSLGKRYCARTWAQLIEDQALISLMARLRHFGFPSPLLDWTQSPYIAAYFAFRDAQPRSEVAVYAYRETTGEGKSTCSGQANIGTIGPNLWTHPKYMQQAQYTLCYSTRDGDAAFERHQDVFARSDHGQDLIVKYILPAEIRDDFLSELNLMNINDHSLFGTREGLCRALAQEFLR